MSNPRTPRTLPYAVVDVFAEQALEGNALAIFPDANSLSSEEMQSIARETNLSETTFVLPRSPAIELERGVHVRIFGTGEEFPFAGHPTLGTASWIHLHHPHLRGASTIHLDLKAGRIPVTFRRGETGQPGIFGTMRQNDPVFGATHDPVAVAAALNLPPEAIDTSAPIQTVSTGMPFCIVPLRSMEAASRLRIPQHTAQAYLGRSDAKFFFCITRCAPGSPANWHARMQFPGGEDPATGSASGCAIAWLVRYGLVPSGQSTLSEQGIEILRPSRLHLQASLLGTHVSDVFVGGRTIPVASGHLFLP
ncbi:MAG: PhzF family phenazine biosynthesis protein [Acidobacteriaceae bacterium]